MYFLKGRVEQSLWRKVKVKDGKNEKDGNDWGLGKDEVAVKHGGKTLSVHANAA